MNSNIFVCFFPLEEALEANDLLTDVLVKYSKIILKQLPSAAGQSTSTSHLIPFVDEHTTQNTMDELNEIFSAQSTEANVLVPHTSPSLNLMEPTSVCDVHYAQPLLATSTATTSSAYNHFNGSSSSRFISTYN